MVKITLKDGAVREAAEGTLILDFVKEVSNSLAKKVLAAKLDGKTVDLTTPITKDCAIDFLTFDEADGRWALRHTGSHILAQAVKRLYKDQNVMLAIGPAIENGFYYDIDMDKQLTDADLRDIEKEMKKIVKENLKLERSEMSRAEARKLFEEKGEKLRTFECVSGNLVSHEKEERGMVDTYLIKLNEEDDEEAAEEDGEEAAEKEDKGEIEK